MKEYRRRLIDPPVGDLLTKLLTLMVTDPRAMEKATTAARHAASIIRLDREAEAAAFRADPDAALDGLPEPALLDEWQVVPAVLGAVKRAVDSSDRPGRFLLTGSVRADIEAETWPGTGRVVRLAMYPLTVAEQMGRKTVPLVDRIVGGEALTAGGDPPDPRGYADLALRGGFPEAALGLSGLARRRWLDGYVDQLLTRDARSIASGRDPVRLRRYFEAVALNSAGLVDEKKIYDAVGINRRTALAYEQLLADLMVIDALPPWSSNRLKRLARSPKRYLVDSSLLVGALGVDTAGVLRDGDVLGRVLDTFVTAQLRAEAVVARARPRLYHLRQDGGRHEIDLVIELGAQNVIGVEIKAGSAPSVRDARHLAWLRDEIGDRFVAGVVLHTGPATYTLGERITAAPICTLWS